MPSSVVPGLVGPFTGIVIAADVCMDACDRADEGCRGGRPVLRGPGGWRAMCGSLGAAVGRGFE